MLTIVPKHEGKVPGKTGSLKRLCVQGDICFLRLGRGGYPAQFHMDKAGWACVETTIMAHNLTREVVLIVNQCSPFFQFSHGASFSMMRVLAR